MDTNKPGKKVFARMSGRWPRTAGSLYTPPYVANFSDYEVCPSSMRSSLSSTCSARFSRLPHRLTPPRPTLWLSQVRYASISSGSRNPPFMNFGTVSDSALVRHFTAKAQER